MRFDHPILQHRRTACGLATLIMIDHHFGGQTTAVQFEAMHGLANQEWSAADLVQNAARLGLAIQALELEPAELPEVSLPCILHWQLNHFVVLRAMRWGRYIVDDPAIGRLTIDEQTFLNHFTGVALTCEPLIDVRSKAISGQTSAPNPHDLTVQLNQIMSLVFCLMAGVLQAGVPLMIKFILDDVVVSQDLVLLQSTVTGLLLALLAMPLMTHLQERALLGCSQRVERNALSSLLGKQIAAPSGTIDAIDTQGALKRLKRLHAFGQFYGAEAVRFLGNLLLALGLLTTLWLIHPASAVLMTVTSAALVGISLWFTQPIISAEKHGANSEHAWLDHLMEWFNHRTEIRRYSAEQSFLHRIHQTLLGSHSIQFLVGNRKAQMTLINQLIVGSALSLLLYGIASEAMIGQMSLGGLYLILAYRGLLTQHVLSMCQQFTSARSAQEIRLDLREITPPTQIAASPQLLRSDWQVHNRYSAQTSQRGALRYLQLSPSTSFSAVRASILNPQPKAASPDSAVQQDLPAPIATAATTDAIFNTTILANITMMTVAPDLARVDRLIQQMALTEAIHRHPLGLDTVITPDQHRFDHFEHARLILTRALYTQPRSLVCELSAVTVASSVMQASLQCLVRTGLIIEVRSHDKIPPIEGLSLVWQTTLGWQQHTESA